MIRTLAHVATAVATSAVALGVWAAPLGLPAPLAQPPAQAGTATPAAPGPAGPAAPASSRLSLNAATAAQLDALPVTGLGKARAQHVFDAKPFASVDELDRVPGLPADVAARLKPLVTV